MLIGQLRKTFYGPSFAMGRAENERLCDVLAKDPSLRRVIRDHEAGTLERVSRSYESITPTAAHDRRAAKWLRPAPTVRSKPPSPRRRSGRTPYRQVIPMGVDAHYYRDKGGEIGRKYGDTPIGILRTSYGNRFAKGCTDHEKLSEVLAKLDEPSLFKLVRDHKSGILPIRVRTFLAG